MHCSRCRGKLVESYKEDHTAPGQAQFEGWRCLRCGEFTEEQTPPPTMRLPWLAGSPAPEGPNPRVYYSLHNGLRRRMAERDAAYSSIQRNGTVSLYNWRA
jgi:hypothetical protein